MSDDLNDVLSQVKDAIGEMDEVPTKATAKKAVPADLSSFPTEMSCSQVFDQLLKCYSIGGQVRHYYRYGEMSYCQDKRDKLLFCLKNKLTTEEERKKRVSQWYMQQLAVQKSDKQTSEEIWQPRTEPLRRPFREDAENYLEKGIN